MSLTREQLQRRFERPTKAITIDGDELLIRKPSPLEKAKYGEMMANPKTFEVDLSKVGPAQMYLVSRMLVDAEGDRLFDDPKELDGMDPTFYESLLSECVALVSGTDREAAKVLGESDATRDSSLPVECA